MHTTLETKEFYERLELVGRISTKHVTLPILECVLLDVRGTGVTLRATNLEIGIEVMMSARVMTEGVVAVPASTLLQVVNLHTEKEVTLRLDGTTLVVEGGGSSSKIRTVPHDEFPTIAKLNGAAQTLNGSLFALGIRATAFAASQSSIKPELGSVHIHQKKEHTLTFVATDSFRLMEKTVPQKGVVLESAILIPFKNALEIARVCDHNAQDPICRIDENQCSLEFPNGVYITSRLTVGSFPDYEQIIPKEYALTATVLKDDLIHAFKKSNVFLNKFFQVRLTVGDNSLTVAADSGEVGTTTEVVKAKVEGEDLTLNFNQRYVAEALGHFVDDSVTLRFAGIGRPMVMVGVSDSSIRYLVMPMNK